MAFVAVLALAGCGASGGSDDDAANDDPTTTEAPPTTDATTTEAPTTEAPATTEAPSPTTTPAAGGALDCQEVLNQYAAAFEPDDLTEVIALFREWVPSMPPEVADATTRLADAYEEADANLANIDMMDQDLSADAEVFSDWTNDGCPPA